MNDFTRCNKVSGIYWLKKPIEETKIRLKLEAVNGISLPKFEEFKNEINDTLLDNKLESFEFKWQEKVFSKWQHQYYSDIHNCATDNDLEYHDVSNGGRKSSKIYTYVHSDNFLSVPSSIYDKNAIHCLERLKCNVGNDSISLRPLFKSEENIADDRQQWIAMHIMFDGSQYEVSELLLKQECILLSIYYNANNNFVIITPDVNNLELNPYTVETQSGLELGYRYAIEIENMECDTGDNLNVLLNKLHRKWEKKLKHLVNFTTPPLGKKTYFVKLEIKSATDFDNDNLYVEFNIKIPEEVQCQDALHGRTHISKPFANDENHFWNFGHNIEMTMETDSETETPHLKLFLEAISTDWWGRHRTEGYSYLPITLHPGQFSRTLTMARPEELNKVEAENRRFFIGGCHLVKDFEMLTDPQASAAFRLVISGKIQLNWSIITQSHKPGSMKPLPSTSTSSALLQGADNALRKYKKARARLAAATKDLYDGQ